jgi:hypothetical protein
MIPNLWLIPYLQWESPELQIHHNPEIRSIFSDSLSHCNFGCGSFVVMVAFVHLLAVAGPVFIIASLAMPAGIGGT